MCKSLYEKIRRQSVFDSIKITYTVNLSFTNLKHSDWWKKIEQPIEMFLIGLCTCGQSYKASTIVNYDSRVVPDLKIPPIMTIEL